MDFTKLANEFRAALDGALSKVTSVESRLSSQEQEVLARKSELEKDAAFNRTESLRLQKVAQDNADKLSEIQTEVSKNQSILSDIEKREKSITDRESKLKSAQVSVEAERTAITEREQEASKKESYLNIKERDLKLTEHKINLVVKDKDVAKELAKIK